MGSRANVVLIGFMGTGKTAVGKRVASRLGRRFVDTDVLIEERAGRSIPRIFAEGGEPAFRRLEAEVIAQVAAGDGRVVATGGGVVLSSANMACLRRDPPADADVVPPRSEIRAHGLRRGGRCASRGGGMVRRRRGALLTHGDERHHAFGGVFHGKRGRLHDQIRFLVQRVSLAQ